MHDVAVEQIGKCRPKVIGVSKHDDGAFIEVDGDARYEFKRVQCYFKAVDVVNVGRCKMDSVISELNVGSSINLSPVSNQQDRELHALPYNAT